MEDTYRPRKQHRRRRGLVALLMMGTAALSIMGASMSLALFTGQVIDNNNAFTAGTIVLGVNPASAILTSSSMMPGDVVPTGVAGQAVTVSNTGTAQLRYAISGSSTDADGLHLNTQLGITVRQADVVGGTSCANFTGTLLFSGLVPTAGVNMVGDPATGAQAGDRVLNSATSETLCFKASLPLGTGNAYQGAASTYTFTFNAEQTANNP